MSKMVKCMIEAEGKTRFSEQREHSTAKSDFSRKPDNPDF